MNIQSAMENFAEAWINANRLNYSSLYSSSSSDQHLLSQRDTRDERTDEISKHSPPFSSHSSHIGAGVNVSPYSAGVRSLPIRCMIQRSESDIGSVQLTNANTLLRDAFAILPSNMLFKDVIRAALLNLGFPSSESIGAKGFIQMRNWKALPFTSIADDNNCTIEDMLGDITSAATLVICLSKVPLEDVEWTDEAVRAAVFQLLKEVSQTTLARISPLPQSMISNIVNAKYMATISTSTCQEFGLWYKEYRRDHQEPLMVSDTTCQNSRQTFHSTYELPLMRGWHQDCPNPTEDALKQYLNELNSSPIRQERGPISLQRLKMWWRNEKQRSERRASIAKLRQATAGSTAPLLDGVDGSLTRRPRKPRRRKSLKVLNQLQPDDSMTAWDRLSYASGVPTNENSLIDCRRDSFESSNRLRVCSDRDVCSSDLSSGNIAGRSHSSEDSPSCSSDLLDHRGASCNSDLLGHRGIPSHGGGDLVDRHGLPSSAGGDLIDHRGLPSRGVEYSPVTCASCDTISSAHAAVYSSIHVCNSMNNRERVESIYNMHTTENSPQGDSPIRQRSIPVSLNRSTWN